METDLKIPESVYVKFQTRKRDKEEYVLGYMIPYDPKDSAFKDRKVSVDTWSQRGKKKNILTNVSWVGVNEPLSGFQILHVVSRYSTDNKVWRVKDPRGFELEISSNNLSELLQEVTLDKGVISTECIWARTRSGENWLMKVGTEAYEKAKEFTEVRSNRISLRDVELGDLVTLHDGRTVQYLGGFYYAEWDYPFFTSRSQGNVETPANVKRKYAFLVQEENGDVVLDFKTSLKVGLMVEKADTPLTPEEAEEIVLHHQRLRSGWSRSELFLSTTKFDIGDVRVFLEDVDPSWVVKGMSFTNLPRLVYEEGDRLYLIEDGLKAIPVHKEPLLKELTCHPYTRTLRPTWGRRDQVTVEKHSLDINALKAKDLKVLRTEVKGTVYDVEYVR